MLQPPRRVLVTTFPFGDVNPSVLDALRAARIECVINPLGRRLREDEVIQLVRDHSAVIAGTEPLTARVLAAAPALRLIARVGIGVDNVDLVAAQCRNIAVTYTPDAPAPAVAELTIGLMLDMLRGISSADRQIRDGRWHRVMGRRLADSIVGVIGCGRIGRRVVRHLQGGFPGVRVLANDIAPDRAASDLASVEWVEKQRIYEEADIITLHLPLTPLTERLIGHRALASMKTHVLLVNASRGNIVVERDLASALRARQIGGAALDVFESEPYVGELTALDNCLLTSHMGSMTRDCRCQMELEATMEVIRFFNGEPLCNIVPDCTGTLVEARS